MKNNVRVLLALLALTGCATTPSEKNPAAYEKSLEQAKIILKSKTNIEKIYEEYYNSPNHKALAESKVDQVGGYSNNRASKKDAIAGALEWCHKSLLKKHDEITEEMSCEVVNVDDEWVTK